MTVVDRGADECRKPKTQSRARARVCATRRRIVLRLGLVPFLAIARPSRGAPLDELRGTFSLAEDGKVIEYIRIERTRSGFVLSRMRAGQWLTPVPVAPVSRQRLQAIIRQPINVAFEGLGDEQLAVVKVPKGWRIGSFVCSTGYLLLTTLGPAELRKL